jgi:hypothetical protein
MEKFLYGRLLIRAVLVVLLFDGGPGWGLAAPQSSCTSAEYHQFDFWAGDWDAFEVADLKTSVAHLRVEKILDGCVLKETYSGANGLEGQSFSIYDQARGIWHQSWVTNHGQLLIIEGGLRDGKMALSGTDKAPDGRDRIVRGTWAPEAGGVRETAVRSPDGGKTWQPWFDLIFKPSMKSAASK